LKDGRVIEEPTSSQKDSLVGNGSDIGAGDDGGENRRLQAIRFVIQILFAQGDDGALETI
jgi:hypothetical protein